MEKNATGWKVYDVVVADLSLVQNYRGTFETEVRKGGIDGLIKALAEKNKQLVTGQAAEKK
jgi:phospholipid transport system substrate-binding protein